MWSRKSRPVETSARPRPSRSTVTLIWVSLLFRVTDPRLLKPYLHGVGMRAEPFQLRKPDCRIAQGLEVAAVQAQNACPLQEGVDAERRREPSGARGRQRVVGARNVVAQRN